MTPVDFGACPFAARRLVGEGTLWGVFSRQGTSAQLVAAIFRHARRFHGQVVVSNGSVKIPPQRLLRGAFQIVTLVHTGSAQAVHVDWREPLDLESRLQQSAPPPSGGMPP